VRQCWIVRGHPCNPGKGNPCTPMDGIFNIDKPQGMTSHDVVARIKRLTKSLGTTQYTLHNSKVGHAGTLDPMATGVLPVVVGKATRLVEYLADADKAYRATVVLGANSSTYDREGIITPTDNARMPSREEVEQALHTFLGEIEQMPPMHSAIKVGGKKLYELARQGIEVERQTRHVTIRQIDLESYNLPTLQIFVECSKGTYIRSLAHDLGVMLGTGAYLGALLRTRHGPFNLEGASTLEELESAFASGTWQEKIYPPEYILANWPIHVVTSEQEHDIIQGKPLYISAPQPGKQSMLAAKSPDRQLLAIMAWDESKGFWQPKKVLL
jgi:tRNA pseudouridine55 synthase